MQAFIEFLGGIGGFLWGPWTFFVLMATGILFTLWTKFTQYAALTHGVAVVRGVYDDPDDPGAINHFQALSAALSATVGLGNIGGVALAIAAGGPGALFWMWIIGFFGMALKTVEITLAMMYRNTDDPDNPHGGAMWVVENVIGGKGGVWKIVARAIGIFFCLTLLVSTFTGGNMFQSWSVADLTYTFWNIPTAATGILLAVVVGLVIIGGIKRIGQVAGRLVPVMCLLYLVSALFVIVLNIGDVPATLALVVKSAFQPTEAGGAFLGGSLAWAFSTGLRRALFSNEAGQGSAPIAHAAAKTDQPAREGIVGGMGPFIDTICICTLTALVILLTGTWNRGPLLPFDTPPMVAPVYALEATPIPAGQPLAIGDDVELALDVTGASVQASTVHGTVVQGEGGNVIEWSPCTATAPPMSRSLALTSGGSPAGTLGAMPATSRAVDGEKPLWGLLSAPQTVEITSDNEHLWQNLGSVFTVVHGDDNDDTGTNVHRITGEATRDADGVITTTWSTVAAATTPTLGADSGLYREYNGASLTAHAFDRAVPGLGKILVTIAAWLFAISTMISWSYYGEQGVVYMLGQRWVIVYKLLFLLGVIFAAVWITDTGDMEALMDLGTGAMLWANLPIVVGLGFLSVRCLDKYGKDLRAGTFKRHDAPSMTDIIGGKDVE